MTSWRAPCTFRKATTRGCAAVGTQGQYQAFSDGAMHRRQGKERCLVAQSSSPLVGAPRRRTPLQSRLPDLPQPVEVSIKQLVKGGTLLVYLRFTSEPAERP